MRDDLFGAEITQDLREELYSEAIANGVPAQVASIMANAVTGEMTEERFERWEALGSVVAAFWTLQSQGIRMINRHGLDVTDVVMSNAVAELAK